jgi:membrane protease YdiL (CAAX protease family)
MPRWQQVAAALGKAACYLALFLGWQMVVSMAFTAAITVDLALSGQMFDEWAMYDVVVSKSMEISLLSDLLTLGSVAALFALRRKRPDREVWLRPAAKTVVLWGMGLAFCLYWLVSLVLGALPESWTQSYAEASSSVEQTGVLAVLATAIVAPVVEEVVFRGLIFTRLRAVCPGWVAVVVSAAIFGACHGELIWFCYAFVLGLIFALMTEKTGSILPGMVMHLVFNSTNEAYMLLLDGLEPMMGDEPGVVYVVMFGVIPFLLATVGTVVCALRLRAAVSAAPVPFVAEKPGTGETVSEAVPAVQCQETPRTAGAAWDQDSGPNHKFPPQRM